MRYLVVLLLITFSSFANAGISSVVIAFDGNSVPVNAYVDMDAEYVALPLSLYSDVDNPKRRAQRLHKLQSVIVDKVNRDKSITLQMGSVSLSPRKTSSFKFSSSYSSSSETTLYLLTPFAKDSNIYSLTQKIIEFVDAIKKPDDTEIRLGNSLLAINNPEEHRLTLLKKIKNEIELTKKVLGNDYKVTVSRLEGAVLVKQQSDRKVRLFINYQLQLNQ